MHQCVYCTLAWRTEWRSIHQASWRNHWVKERAFHLSLKAWCIYIKAIPTLLQTYTEHLTEARGFQADTKWSLFKCGLWFKSTDFSCGCVCRWHLSQGQEWEQLKEVKKELSKTFRIKNLVLLHHLSRSKSYSISSYWYHLCGNPTKEHWAAVKEW